MIRVKFVINTDIALSAIKYKNKSALHCCMNNIKAIENIQLICPW